MTLSNIVKSAGKVLRENSPTILSAIGVSGTITTAYLAGKASFQAAFIIQKDEDENGSYERPIDRLKHNAGLVWKLYIPAGISGAITVGCIVSSARVSSKRTAVVTAAYSLSERAFSEYKEKVVEKIGENKEQAIRDEIAQDRVTNNPPKDLVVVGNGTVLCCELHTGRYFNSDMESLRKAQNDINAMLNRHDSATLTDFYHLIGLPVTTFSSNTGWTSDKLMELEFSTVLSEDSRPCIAFAYNYVHPF